MRNPEEIRTRQELAEYVRELVGDLTRNENAWENTTVDRYLEAFAAWTDDMDGYFMNRGQQTPEQPTWALVGMMLTAASIYE